MSCDACGYAGIPATRLGVSWCPSCEPTSPEFLALAESMHAAGRRLRHRLPRLVPVGRNDPCPCGSGRKWKKCHGRSATSAGTLNPR